MVLFPIAKKYLFPVKVTFPQIKSESPHESLDVITNVYVYSCVYLQSFIYASEYSSVIHLALILHH